MRYVYFENYFISENEDVFWGFLDDIFYFFNNKNNNPHN